MTLNAKPSQTIKSSLMQQELSIGLALGGGGARGLGHIPVIAALDELGLKANAIAGTSIGALIGTAYACGLNAIMMSDYFLDAFSNTNQILKRLWSTKPQSFKELWSRGLRISQFNLEVILSAFLPKEISTYFHELDIPLNIIATDLHSAKMVILNEGELCSAMAASASLPGVFKPVKRDDYLLIDGGVCNPIPFDCIPQTQDKKKCDLIIGVDITGFIENQYINNSPTLLQSLMAANMCAQTALTQTRLQIAQPDLLLCPPVEGIYVLDFLKTKEILENVMSYKEEAKRAITHAVEHILKTH